MAAFSAYRKQAEKHLLERQEKMPDVFAFDEDIPNNCSFTFVDFAAATKWSREGNKQFTFSQVVDYANDWLKKHEIWEVMGCETHRPILEINQDPRHQDSVITVQADSENTVGDSVATVTCRLWLKKKTDEKPIQQIKYIDFIPENIENEQFEALDSVLKKINEKIKNKEIGGKIINIQTHAYGSNDWTIDPESTFALVGDNLVYIIRIFYEVGPPCCDEVAIHDFIPQSTSSGSIFKPPKFESQSETIKRASKWISDNPQINFCSAQTLAIKMKSMVADTQQMAYTRKVGDFVRIIRITYTKPSAVSQDNPKRPIYLICETVPIKNSIAEAKKTICEFFAREEWSAEEANKWEFLNCETLIVLASNRRNLETRVNKSFTANRITNKMNPSTGVSLNYNTYYAIRIYYDGGINSHNNETSVESPESPTSESGKSDACILS